MNVKNTGTTNPLKCIVYIRKYIVVTLSVLPTFVKINPLH